MPYENDTFYHLSVVEMEEDDDGELEIDNEKFKDTFNTQQEVAECISENNDDWGVSDDDEKKLELTEVNTENGEWSVQTKPIQNILMKLV